MQRSGEEDEEEEGISQEDQELLDTINEAKEQNQGRLDDQIIIQFFREKLHSMPCQNQGFVLDGFPKTMEQAKAVFAGKFATLVKLGAKIFCAWVRSLCKTVQ